MVRSLGSSNGLELGQNGRRHARTVVAVALGAALIGGVGLGVGPESTAGAEGPTVPMVAVQELDGKLTVVRYDAPVADSADSPVDGAPDTPAAVASLGSGTTLVVEADSPVRAFGDPLESQQWALEPEQTSFRKAWATTKGAGVVVAVVDSGVRKTHEDLAGVVLPGIDLVTGSGDGSNDQNGHGTHVAGIIAAQANGKGIVGGAPGVKILPIRVLDGSGSGYSSDVAEGIIWATDHGAQVVNLSLGGGVPSDATRTAIQYANEHGVVVLAAAGNAGQTGNAPLYPAAFSEPIAVGAISANRQRAPFSNWGTYVDVVAPGDAIVSLWSSSNNTYAWASGTSMATPYAAATAALVLAANPSFTPDQVRGRIEQTADDLGAAGRDPHFGAGLVDPANAARVALPAGGNEGKGYFVVTSDGRVRAYGRAKHRGDLGGFPVGSPVVAAARTPSGAGYWLATRSGLVLGFGDAKGYGHLRTSAATGNVVAMASSASGKGYLVVTAKGRVRAFGDAQAFGSAPRGRVIRDIAVTPNHRGYWLLDADGRAYPFGDARYGATGRGAQVGRGAVSFALSTNGRGFWAVRRDGGVAAYAAEPYGSLRRYASATNRHGTRLRAVSSGGGYYVLTNDGLVYSFGSARYHGSTQLRSATAVELLPL